MQFSEIPLNTPVICSYSRTSWSCLFVLTKLAFSREDRAVLIRRELFSGSPTSFSPTKNVDYCSWYLVDGLDSKVTVIDYCDIILK